MAELMPIDSNLFCLVLRLNVRNSSHFPVNILGTLLHPADIVKNQVVWFDADFSFSEHIQKTKKACFLQMRDLGRITWYLTHKLVVFAANVFVILTAKFQAATCIQHHHHVIPLLLECKLCYSFF